MGMLSIFRAAYRFLLTLLTTLFSPANKFSDKTKAAAIVQQLRNKGHNVTEDADLADVNGVSYYQEKVAAHGDSRRGGGQGSDQF